MALHLMLVMSLVCNGVGAAAATVAMAGHATPAAAAPDDPPCHGASDANEAAGDQQGQPTVARHACPDDGTCCGGGAACQCESMLPAMLAAPAIVLQPSLPLAGTSAEPTLPRAGMRASAPFRPPALHV